MNCNENEFRKTEQNITNNYQVRLKYLQSARLVVALEASPLAVLEQIVWGWEAEPNPFQVAERLLD